MWAFCVYNKCYWQYNAFEIVEGIRALIEKVPIAPLFEYKEYWKIATNENFEILGVHLTQRKRIALKWIDFGI